MYKCKCISNISMYIQIIILLLHQPKIKVYNALNYVVKCINVINVYNYQTTNDI